MDNGFTKDYEEVYDYELVEQIKLGMSFEDVAKTFNVSIERVKSAAEKKE